MFFLPFLNYKRNVLTQTSLSLRDPSFSWLSLIAYPCLPLIFPNSVGSIFLKKPLTNFFAVWYYIILIEVNKTYGDISMGAQIPDPSINLKFLIIKRAWVLIWKSGCQVLMSSHFQQSFFKRTDQGRSSALQAKIKIAQGRLQNVALLAPCSSSLRAGW